MFYQVRPEDTSFLRSLCWIDGNSSSNVVEFQMVVHLFGVTSSPTVPTFTFEKLLKIGQDISVMRQLRVFLKMFKWMIVSSFGTIWVFLFGERPAKTARQWWIPYCKVDYTGRLRQGSKKSTLMTSFLCFVT